MDLVNELIEHVHNTSLNGDDDNGDNGDSSSGSIIVVDVDGGEHSGRESGVIADTPSERYSTDAGIGSKENVKETDTLEQPHTTLSPTPNSTDGDTASVVSGRREENTREINSGEELNEKDTESSASVIVYSNGNDNDNDTNNDNNSNNDNDSNNANQEEIALQTIEVETPVQTRKSLLAPFGLTIEKNLDAVEELPDESDSKLLPEPTAPRTTSGGVESPSPSSSSLFGNMFATLRRYSVGQHDGIRTPQTQTYLNSNNSQSSVASSPSATLYTRREPLVGPSRGLTSASALNVATGPFHTRSVSNVASFRSPMSAKEPVKNRFRTSSVSSSEGDPTGFQSYVRREYKPIEMVSNLAHTPRSSSNQSTQGVPERPVVGRRGAHNKSYSISNYDLAPIPNSPAADGLGYNPKRFKEETYLDTRIHYASDDRNRDFHTLFDDILEEEWLIDDFSCALSKDFLYQGRLYITTAHLCFNSSILGWKSRDVIPFKKITFLDKTSTAGLFPNAISIEMKDETLRFTNFISRDKSFDIMKEVWSRNLLELEESGYATSFSPLSSPSPSSSLSLSLEEGAEEKSAIDVQDSKRSANVNGSVSKSLSLEEKEKREETPKENPTALDTKQKKNSYKIYRFKSTSQYRKYDFGPFFSSKSDNLPKNSQKYHEFVLAETELNCTPNQAFQIMFNNEDYRFIDRFILSLDAAQFRPPEQYIKDQTSGLLTRKYQYEKSLKNFPGGPKSTRCFVTEEIVENDPERCIVVVSTVKTPDVPSGGAFETKTRYVFRWGANNSCVVLISFWVNWIGSSWIKMMIESGCKSGQTTATEKALRILREMIEEEIVSENVEADSEELKGLKEARGAVIGKELTEEIASNVPLGKEVGDTSSIPTVETHAQSEDTHRTITALLLVVIALLLFLNWRNQRNLRREIAELRGMLYELHFQQGRK